MPFVTFQHHHQPLTSGVGSVWSTKSPIMDRYVIIWRLFDHSYLLVVRSLGMNNLMKPSRNRRWPSSTPLRTVWKSLTSTVQLAFDQTIQHVVSVISFFRNTVPAPLRFLIVVQMVGVSPWQDPDS